MAHFSWRGREDGLAFLDPNPEQIRKHYENTLRANSEFLRSYDWRPPKRVENEAFSIPREVFGIELPPVFFVPFPFLDRYRPKGVPRIFDGF